MNSISMTTNFLGVFNSQRKLLTKKRVEKILSGHKEKLPEDHLQYFVSMAQCMKTNPESSIQELIRFVLNREGIDESEFTKRKQDRLPSAQRLPSFSTFYRWASIITSAYESADVKVRAEIINQNIVNDTNGMIKNTADVRFSIYSANSHKRICEFILPIAATEKVLQMYQNEIQYTN